MGYFNYVFENNSLKRLFGQNTKKLKILQLSRDFRNLQKLALKLQERRINIFPLALCHYLIASFSVLRNDVYVRSEPEGYSRFQTTGMMEGFFGIG